MSEIEIRKGGEGHCRWIYLLPNVDFLLIQILIT